MDSPTHSFEHPSWTALSPRQSASPVNAPPQAHPSSSSAPARRLKRLTEPGRQILTDYYVNVTHYPSLEQKHALLDLLQAAGVEYHMNNLNAWFANRRKKENTSLSSRDLLWPSITQEKEKKIQTLLTDFPQPSRDMINSWAVVVSAQPEHITLYIQHMAHSKEHPSPPATTPARPASTSFASIVAASNAHLARRPSAHSLRFVAVRPGGSPMDIDSPDDDTLENDPAHLPTPSVSTSPEPVPRSSARPHLTPIQTAVSASPTPPASTSTASSSAHGQLRRGGSSSTAPTTSLGARDPISPVSAIPTPCIPRPSSSVLPRPESFGRPRPGMLDSSAVPDQRAAQAPLSPPPTATVTEPPTPVTAADFSLLSPLERIRAMRRASLQLSGDATSSPILPPSISRAGGSHPPAVATTTTSTTTTATTSTTTYVLLPPPLPDEAPKTSAEFVAALRPWADSQQSFIRRVKNGELRACGLTPEMVPE